MTEADLRARGQAERERQNEFECRVFCCGSTSCRMSGSQAVAEAIRHRVAGRADVVLTGCMGLCSHGPLVRIEHRDKPARLLTYMNASDIWKADADSDLIDSPFPHKEFSLADPFFAKQRKVVTATLDRNDPTSLAHYLATGGYLAFAEAILRRDSEEVCDDISRSGLRGRGGAGYPAGLKWNAVRRAKGVTKFVVANGDEGDPGAFMDRTIIEDDPHRLLEGMLIAAYAVGASDAFLYVRVEVPAAVERFNLALADAQAAGLVGPSILGSSFSCDVHVRMGAGAFVCGEETALMASIEGKRGIPRLRPPYPPEHGIHGLPTLINNVETLANVPTIAAEGPEAFAAIGTGSSRGTKVFSMSGSIQRSGVVEVPLGISLRSIVFEMGGGPKPGHQIKAVQCGGPSGGCVPEKDLDLIVDYDTMKQFGVIMGSGGMIVLDEQTDMVRFSKYFMDFCRDESCGKCVPCRVGTVQMSRLLERIDRGDGSLQDLDRLIELGELLQQASLCGLGQAAPNPVLGSLRHFRSEFLAKVDRQQHGMKDLSHLILPSLNVGDTP